MKNISNTYLELSKLLQKLESSNNEHNREFKILQIVTLVNNIANAFFKEVNDHNLEVFYEVLQEAEKSFENYDHKISNISKRRDISEYNEEFKRVLVAVRNVMIKEDIKLASKIEQAMEKGLKNFIPIVV